MFNVLWHLLNLIVKGLSIELSCLGYSVINGNFNHRKKLTASSNSVIRDVNAAIVACNSWFSAKSLVASPLGLSGDTCIFGSFYIRVVLKKESVKPSILTFSRAVSSCEAGEPDRIRLLMLWKKDNRVARKIGFLRPKLHKELIVVNACGNSYTVRDHTEWKKKSRARRLGVLRESYCERSEAII